MFWPECWKTKHCPPSPQALQFVINFSPLFWQLIFTWKLKKKNLITKLPLFAKISLPNEMYPHRQTELISEENVAATSKNKSFFMVLTALLRLRAERSAYVKVEEIKRLWRVTKPMWKHHQPETLHIRIHTVYMFTCVFHTDEYNQWHPSPDTHTIRTVRVCISVLLVISSHHQLRKKMLFNGKKLHNKRHPLVHGLKEVMTTDDRL